MKTISEFSRSRVGKTVVFTNGVFDILHAGHVQLLTAAKQMGDILVVGVNSDLSVRNLAKGENRPVHPLEDRMTILAALKMVDFVFAFEESTPENLIQLINPDVHVKGGDYHVSDLPEAKFVLQNNKRVAIFPILEGRSTTIALEKQSKKESD